MKGNCCHLDLKTKDAKQKNVNSILVDITTVCRTRLMFLHLSVILFPGEGRWSVNGGGYATPLLDSHTTGRSPEILVN